MGEWVASRSLACFPDLGAAALHLRQTRPACSIFGFVDEGVVVKANKSNRATSRKEAIGSQGVGG